MSDDLVVSKNPKVVHWLDEIKMGIDFQEKYSTYKKWSDWREMYRGNWSPTVVPVNRIFSYGRALIPRIYFHSPRITVTATKPELVPHAIVVEAVDNWLIRETKLKKVLKSASLQTYLCGNGPIKLGFDSEFGYLPELSVDRDSGTATQIGRKKGNLIEYSTTIKPGMPWAAACRPEDVIVPWGSSDLDNLPWICHRILRPLKDVKEDQKYSNTGKLQGSRIADLRKKNDSIVYKDKDLKYCELFEIRDVKSGKIIVLCEQQILLEEDDALQIEGLPYEQVVFNEDPEYFWAIPDAQILEPQQLELNEVRTQASKHRRIALLKFLYQKGSITEEQMNAFLSGNVGPAVGIDAEILQQAIITITPHIPPDLAGEAMMVLRDMQISMGFNENASGSFKQGTPPTATEAQNVGESFDLRIDERKDILADVMTNIIRKWNQMIFSFWDGERVAQIAGPQGQMFWVRFTGEELQGEYNYKIDPESGFPVTSQLRKQFADGLMKQYGGDQLIDQMRLRKLHLQQYEDIMPGLTGLITPPVLTPEQLAAQQRQPGPEGGGGAGSPQSEGNRGGGMRSAKTDPIAFKDFQAKVLGGQK